MLTKSDKALGRIDIERFNSMSGRYSDEYQNLKERLETLNIQIQSIQQSEINTELFINTIKKYSDLKELTLPILSELVDKVVVSEREKRGKNIFQRVDIHYRFVGFID